MQSKEHIQNKRDNKDLTFKFHQLDKANRHIYIKKIADEAIPAHFISLTKNSLPPVQREPEDISQSFHFKNNLPEES